MITIVFISILYFDNSQGLIDNEISVFTFNDTGINNIILESYWTNFKADYDKNYSGPAVEVCYAGNEVILYTIRLYKYLQKLYEL